MSGFLSRTFRRFFSRGTFTTLVFLRDFLTYVFLQHVFLSHIFSSDFSATSFLCVVFTTRFSARKVLTSDFSPSFNFL